MDKQSLFLSFDEITAVIKAHHANGLRRTILIEGENGIGKTAVYHTLRDRKSTRLNSSHVSESRMPSSA